MVYYTDSPSFANRVLPKSDEPWVPVHSASRFHLDGLARNLFGDTPAFEAPLETSRSWKHLFLAGSADRSQYDILVEMCQANNPPPEGVICLAGKGEKFHGFRGRPWMAPAGNIYLSAFLAPNRPLDNFGIGFTILSAISVIDTIDSLPGLKGRAGIKWVNDVLIGSAKVGGVLAHTQVEGDTVTGVVLGIGLNVETTPIVPPTPFVPKVTSLSDFLPSGSGFGQADVLERLIDNLDSNYRSYLTDGYMPLFERYKDRSLVIGREVEIRSDEPGEEGRTLARGRVADLGENLELILEGQDGFVTKGRLILQTGLDA